MKLVIGGYAQGKLGYVLSKYRLTKDTVWNGALPGDSMPADTFALSDPAASTNSLPLRSGSPNAPVVLNHFHLWVKERIAAGGCPEEEIFAFLDGRSGCIIISDEIGNGIVPAEAFEREYRERLGRLLIRLAEEAEEVERVICGIGQKIK